MHKLVLASLALSLSVSSLSAHPDEYEKEGKVFSFAKAFFVKEQDERTEKITHKPKGGVLSLATVEYVSAEAVLHYNYFESSPNMPSINSFWITPNTHRLTAESQLHTLPQEETLASLPIRLAAGTNKIELLFFGKPNMEAHPKYTATIAAAVKIILSEFVPAIIKSGTCPGIRAVVIPDAEKELAQLMSEPEYERIGSFKQTYVSKEPQMGTYKVRYEFQ